MAIDKFFLFLLCSFCVFTINAKDFISIEDFGAKMDGITDDSHAIQKSLKELNYAYIPQNPLGVKINKTIVIKGNQKLFGLTRGSKIISYVAENQYAIIIEEVTFGESAEISDLSIEIKNKNTSGIQIINSRNAFIDNIFIDGKGNGRIGIQINGGTSVGSAWNQVSRYTILKCDVGIEIISRTKLNWSNRNNIDFGVVQSCRVGLRLDKANTNRLLVNPQGCDIGFQVIASHYNRFESFEENSSQISVEIDKSSRQNIFSGEFSPAKIIDKGSGNTFQLNSKKQSIYNDLREK
jgi:hypothetical protein